MNENTTTAAPGRKERLTRKEKHARWKAAKRARKQEQREYYRYAPWPKKVWNLWLKKVLKVVMVLLIIAGVVAANMETIFNEIVVPVLQKSIMEQRNKPLTEEQKKQIYELSPIDEEGAGRIDALPASKADETWTISVYIVGADLEDDLENDLSYVTTVMTREAAKSAADEQRMITMDRLNRYNTELADNGLELPKFFYYPDVPVASSTVVTQDVHVSERTGMASADISEMTSGVWGDNIQIVIQTGGATHWTNDLINPNRTQRFLYKGGKFTEVADLPLQPASETDTLAGFLRFCRDEYPADHNVLVLWDHGGGPFGYGQDSIFGKMLSLKDVREALSSVYRPDSANPAFDIIGFDACLMSCLEVTHALDGFANYYCLSEESIPGDGWDYAPWLQALTDDPTMSPARVGREIADSFTDYYVTQNINVPMLENNTTFSVIDAHKASELYDAYSALCEAQLVDAAEDLGVLADIGRCGARATRYGDNHANVFNTADLGNYVDYTIDSYPEQSSRIKELVKEAVLYHRESGALGDSTGIAVYIPTDVSDLNGLLYYLDYVYDVSESDSVRSLYYYKQAGCLNEEMKEYVATLTDKEPEVLDITAFNNFSKAEPAIDAEGFVIPVDAELQRLMTEYRLELGKYDADTQTITYYGRADALQLDGEGGLACSFDGTWICLNGEPLYVEPVSSTAAGIEYKAHVNYDGEEAYLIIACDRDTGECSISSIRKVEQGNAVNSLASTRSRIEPEAGKFIVPLYVQSNFKTGETKSVEGKKIRFTSHTSVTREQLPKGYYLATAVISDSRGDNYYSQVVGADMASKGISEWKLDERFFGRDY
ncbi:MAG: hypothetical protein K6G66_12310 [Oscillospiraceae bacterium]|nr:hypothetical protein [Oscillospiraceae bacterium]